MVAAVTGFPARSRRRPHGGPTPSRRYERRRPEKTPLHKIISENLESWLAWREAAERPVPGYVEDELRGYLECGILCFGFAHAVCTTCRTGFVVAFSCKGRGVCPSCNGHHMTQTAAHLADHVIPPVPVRQWVISVPKRLRGMLADRPQAVAALTKIFLDEIERLLLAVSVGTPDADMSRAARPRLGGISFLHRFGAALNHHVQENSGFSIDASVRITLLDRDVPSYFQSLEHLLRYCGVIELAPFEFLDRLADLIPQPRKHRHRYYGVFAPNHKLRRAVTALAIGRGLARVPQEQVPVPGCGEKGGKKGTGTDCCAAGASPSHDTSRIAWTKLMARVGEEFPLECPACGGDIRLKEDGRQEPASFEPEVRKREKARMASPA